MFPNSSGGNSKPPPADINKKFGKIPAASALIEIEEYRQLNVAPYGLNHSCGLRQFCAKINHCYRVCPIPLKAKTLQILISGRNKCAKKVRKAQHRMLLGVNFQILTIPGANLKLTSVHQGHPHLECMD